MFRSLPLVTVRQHQHQSADASPFHFSRGDELVDHDLRSIGEVPELRLPYHQLVRFCSSVTVFKSEYRFFREYRIDDNEIRLAFANVLQRNIGARVPALAVLVVPHRVAMKKSTATAVLPGQAYGETVL